MDRLLVSRGLAASREQARGLILAGTVLVDERRVDKPGEQVPQGAVLRLKEGARAPYVSRGGVKLEAAIRSFGLRVDGAVALDVGASTGGFTDCLLQHGARKVFAVDVGRGQLAWKLRRDPRVVNIERRNIRFLEPGDLDEAPGLAVIDVSFISLSLVIPRVLALVAPAAEIVALVKPQFEVGKGKVGKGGVVKDPALHDEVLGRLHEEARGWGLQIKGVIPSPLLGPKGNKEFLLYGKAP